MVSSSSSGWKGCSSVVGVVVSSSSDSNSSNSISENRSLTDSLTDSFMILYMMLCCDDLGRRFPTSANPSATASSS